MTCKSGFLVDTDFLIEILTWEGGESDNQTGIINGVPISGLCMAGCVENNRCMGAEPHARNDQCSYNMTP